MPYDHAGNIMATCAPGAEHTFCTSVQADETAFSVLIKSLLKSKVLNLEMFSVVRKRKRLDWLRALKSLHVLCSLNKPPVANTVLNILGEETFANISDSTLYELPFNSRFAE
eukprot:5751970-Pleurochrysis_carterae.AAC.3